MSETFWKLFIKCNIIIFASRTKLILLHAARVSTFWGELTLRSVHAAPLNQVPSFPPFTLPRRLSKFLKFDVDCIVLLTFLPTRICIRHAPLPCGEWREEGRKEALLTPKINPQNPVALSPNATNFLPKHYYKSKISLPSNRLR